MKALAFVLLSVFLFDSALSFGQVQERSVDFTISPSLISEGKIQVAYEWISPSEFAKKDLSLLDLPKISSLHPGNNQLTISKVAFISQKSFDELSYAKMNNSTFISQMLNSISISKKSADAWSITNKVKAFQIPFKVSFQLKFNEVSASSLGAAVSNYLRDEGAASKNSGRERFLILDMTNFSQLVYRNYSVVYLKEINANETLVVAGVVAAININSANLFFNHPPFTTAKETMMSNIKTQIMQMARSIQKN